jgi:transcriptional regulator with XRE-family HTH domain
MTTQETFVTRLRRHRERNRISLEQLAHDTNIKQPLLEALEQNDLSEWPHGLYARAWIRAYADAVGLDPEDTVDDFCRLYPHGDRRAKETIRGLASIVASPPEYRDEINHPDRRQAEPGDEAIRHDEWTEPLSRVSRALRTRLSTLRVVAGRGPARTEP